MDVKDAIEARRAYRSLRKEQIPKEVLEELARCASLAPSCYNKQPWRYVFVASEEKLSAMRGAMSKGNEWTYNASAIVAVLSKPDLDCVLPDGRRYYAFDVGLSVGIMILRATEMGLVAHPIAGYSPERVKEVLGVPEDYEVITLVIVGPRMEGPNPLLSEKQAAAERERPPRLPLGEFAYLDEFGRPLV